jgi:hypothetical protein
MPHRASRMRWEQRSIIALCEQGLTWEEGMVVERGESGVDEGETEERVVDRRGCCGPGESTQHVT